jgi:hypothetical protein
MNQRKEMSVTIVLSIGSSTWLDSCFQAEVVGYSELIS